MTNVLSFFQYEPHPTVNFVLIRSQSLSNIYRLTPQVMHLEEDLYVLDLHPTHNYWRKLAEYQDQNYINLISELLQENYPGLIILCHHPFQGYLLYQNLYQREGIFFSDAKIIKNLYTSFSYQQWIDTTRRMYHILTEKKLIKEDTTLSQLNRLKKLIQSLGVKDIKEMGELDHADLQRRFNAFIGLAWKWTFPDQVKATDTPLLNLTLDIAMLDFPWLQYKLHTPPQVKTHLEYPLTDWEHLVPHLEDSFIQLARKREARPPHYVLAFQWSVTLFDLEACQIPIVFKFPLDLVQQQEQDFATLKIQFEFAFTALNERLKEKYQHSDHINCAYIIGWELQITQTLCPSARNEELFENLRSHQIKLEEFQNQIKNPLLRYQVLPIHIPSLDYQIHQNQEENFNSPPLKLQPFHLFPTPLLLEENALGDKRFIERTSHCWWEEQDPQSSYRDYYMCEYEGRIIYAFKDYQGKWYQHGLFS